MNTLPFPACTCGRMVSFVLALVAAAGGLIAVLSNTPQARAIIPFAILIAVGGGLMSALIGFKDDLRESAGILLVLPVVTTAVLAGIPFLPGAGVIAGGPLFAFAAVMTWWGLYGYRLLDTRRA